MPVKHISLSKKNIFSSGGVVSIGGVNHMHVPVLAVVVICCEIDRAGPLLDDGLAVFLFRPNYVY